MGFTKRLLADIEPPQGRESKAGGMFDTYRDTRQKGLILIVSNGGAKTFYFYGKINGRPERVRLGTFPAMSVEKAREAAAATRLKIDGGQNPQHERQTIRKEITFKEIFDQYLERYSKRHKKTWQNDEIAINRFLSGWLSRKLSSITNHDVRKIHEHITDNNGPYQANRVYEVIRSIFNKAIEWGWSGVNPAVGIQKNREKSRDRFLHPDEMPRFLESVRKEDNTTARDYIFLSLLTGARKTNVLTMRWDHISLERAEWRIPETKNGEPLVIPLSEEAIKILLGRRKVNPNSQWVFPGKGKNGHLLDPKKAWGRILARAKIEDLRIHDLRRTLGSWQAANGATSFIIGKSLGHKSHQATAIYARLNLDPVRHSVQAATKAMFSAGES